MKSIQLVGIPFDGKSSFLRGAAGGPSGIRKALHDGSSNYTSENDVDIREILEDTGDLEINSYEDIFPELGRLLQKDVPAVILGGDHSITYPIIKTLNTLQDDFDLLLFDAHSDLYHEYEGDLYSHACPFARIMEEGLVKRLVQVGIRTGNEHLREQAGKFGVEIIPMNRLELLNDLEFSRNLYISVDLDGFDPAYAPGVSHYEPGGLVPREVINFIQSLSVSVIGADIVELNPGRDHHGMTAALASKILKELCGKMASDKGQ
jgi:agmatinase